jgi:hypothetical protein
MRASWSSAEEQAKPYFSRTRSLAMFRAARVFVTNSSTA